MVSALVLEIKLILFITHLDNFEITGFLNRTLFNISIAFGTSCLGGLLSYSLKWLESAEIKIIKGNTTLNSFEDINVYSESNFTLTGISKTVIKKIHSCLFRMDFYQLKKMYWEWLESKNGKRKNWFVRKLRMAFLFMLPLEFLCKYFLDNFLCNFWWLETFIFPVTSLCFLQTILFLLMGIYILNAPIDY